MAEQKPLRLLNVKVTEELRSLITTATELSGMRSMSEWMREALEAGARQEIAGHQRQASQRLTTAALNGTATRRLGMSVGPAGCSHPLPAREQTVEAEVCGLCGAVTRWKV